MKQIVTFVSVLCFSFFAFGGILLNDGLFEASNLQLLWQNPPFGDEIKILEAYVSPYQPNPPQYYQPVPNNEWVSVVTVSVEVKNLAYNKYFRLGVGEDHAYGMDFYCYYFGGYVDPRRAIAYVKQTEKGTDIFEMRTRFELNNFDIKAKELWVNVNMNGIDYRVNFAVSDTR